MLARMVAVLLAMINVFVLGAAKGEGFLDDHKILLYVSLTAVLVATMCVVQMGAA